MDDNKTKTCQRCGRSFTTRTNLAVHLGRKTPCVTALRVGENNAIKKFKCWRCDASFQTKQNLNAHLARKNPCQRRYSDEEQKILDRLIEEHRAEHLRLLSEGAKDETACINVSHNTTNTDNRQSTTTTLNNTTFNITAATTADAIAIAERIVPYGQEIMSHITDDMYVRCFRDPFQAAKRGAQLKHFSKQMPCNHNVFISNMKSPHMIRYARKGEWELIDKSKGLMDIYYDVRQNLAERFEEMLEKGDLAAGERLVKDFGAYLNGEMTEVMEERICEKSCDAIASMAYNQRHEPMAHRAIMDRQLRDGAAKRLIV